MTHGIVKETVSNFYLRGIIEKTMHNLILETSDRNYQNTIITTIRVLTSGYDH